MVISTFWLIVVFIGAFALFAAIYYAKRNNRLPPEQVHRTEQATRDLYEKGTTDESSYNR